MILSLDESSQLHLADTLTSICFPLTSRNNKTLLHHFIALSSLSPSNSLSSTTNPTLFFAAISSAQSRRQRSCARHSSPASDKINMCKCQSPRNLAALVNVHTVITTRPCDTHDNLHNQLGSCNCALCFLLEGTNIIAFPILR